MRERGDIHLETEPRDAAESGTVLEDFLSDFIGTADEERAMAADERVKMSARDGRPAALFADLGESVGVTGKKLFGGLLVGGGDVTESVYAHFELLRRMPGGGSGFPIEIDERAEASGLTADDGDHQRQAECAGADERLGGAADADPNGQRVLQRTRIDALAGERGAVAAGPRDVFVGADLQEEIELLGEERVIVFQLQAEERERLDEGAAADDHLGAALREQIEGGELLKHAHGIGGAEHGDGAGEADAGSFRGGGGENDGRGGVEEVAAVMLADAEVVEPDRLGVGDARDEIAQGGRSVVGEIGGLFAKRGGEAVEADFKGRAGRGFHGPSQKVSGLQSKNRFGLVSEPAVKIDTWVMWPRYVHMKTATVRDLRNNFSKLEAWLSDGESVRIEKRGEPVALLTALPRDKSKAFKMPDFAARRRSIWGDRVFSAAEVKAMRDAELEGDLG